MCRSSYLQTEMIRLALYIVAIIFLDLGQTTTCCKDTSYTTRFFEVSRQMYSMIKRPVSVTYFIIIYFSYSINSFGYISEFYIDIYVRVYNKCTCIYFDVA